MIRRFFAKFFTPLFLSLNICFAAIYRHPARAQQRIFKNFSLFFSQFSLQKQKFAIHLHSQSAIGLWCNGNTTDSGPVILGSNPGSPTQAKCNDLCKRRGFFICKTASLNPFRAGCFANNGRSGATATRCILLANVSGAPGKALSGADLSA